MNTTFRRGRGLWVGVMLATAAAALAGCKGKGQKASSRSNKVNQAMATGQHLTLDGQFNDWPASDIATIADDDFIYFRVSVEGQSGPIQASRETLELWLDVDGNARTGRVMPAPADAAGLGVDLVVAYSPADPDKPGQTKPGVQVTAFDPGGAAIPLSAAQIGLASLPTYVAPQYEVRISRHINPAAAPALAQAMQAKGTGRGMFVLKDGSGRIVGWSDPETFQKAQAAKGVPVGDSAIPGKKRGTVRVVSYNVLKSELTKNPGTFARVFQVLDADIVLCQEWETDPTSAGAWFTAVVTGTHPWYARTGPDVAIVSPYQIAPLGPDSITYPGADKPVRFVAGVVKTPAGDVAVGTAHLKCCGTAGSPEDQRRLAEARAINGAMKSAMGQLSTPFRVIGGDFNVVGTADPLGAIATGLDADGSDLMIAQPIVLGDTSMVTWADPKTDFPPGRLDYVLVGDAGAVVTDAFVLDTTHLSAKALAKMGLDHSDTLASDHSPVVVDIKPK
jgi:endonuclease/exonuclease/phosphatase family metal-dependent hydrolase